MPVEDTGEHQLKNIARPVRVYRVATDRDAETVTDLRHCRFSMSRRSR
jgi:class 3 adenylate cyclase